MNPLQRWIWGGTGSFHDIYGEDKFWRQTQYIYGATAIIAAAVATRGMIASAEAAAGPGALFARAGTGVGSTVAALGGATGKLDAFGQGVQQRVQSVVQAPATQAEVQAVTARLSQLQGQMDPTAAYKRTLGMLRSAGGSDLVASGRRDLPVAFRNNALAAFETGVKLFDAHAERTLILAAYRLNSIFPGYYMPRILITTVNICGPCRFLIEASGGFVFGPREVIWK
jgi:hypothetical protein